MKCPFVIRVCNTCKRILVANEMNFCKDKKGKWGLSCRCRICTKVYNKKYQKENKEKIKEQREKYYEKNKEKIYNYQKKHREDNEEHIKERKKRYYEKNKKNILIHVKEYRENNKDKIKERRKEYYENNPHKTFDANSRRRQKEEKQGKGFTKEQWLEMMCFFDWKCAYSGEKLNKDNRSIDHIVPLDKGGEHEIWNLVPMHKSYNSSKFTNDMLRWYTQQEFYSEERLNRIYEWIEYAKNKYNNQ